MATVSESMSKDVCAVDCASSLADVAKTMADQDMGFLPVTDGGKLVGAITDRDLVVRGIAKGCGMETRVQQIMSTDVKSVKPEDDFQQAMQTMADAQLRRLPVVDADNTLVGVVALADAAQEKDPAVAGQALGQVTQKGGEHAS